MVKVTKHGIILHTCDHFFESEGVLNPGVIKVDGKIHMFYRAVAIDNYSTIGYCLLSSPLKVEHRNPKPLLIPQFDYEFQGLEDPRIVKIDKTFYMTYTAYDGVNALGALATSEDLVHWKKHGIVVPQVTYDEFMHFTKNTLKSSPKYNRYNLEEDVRLHFKRKVFIWDKNLIFFPRKIKGSFYFIHRIKPDIQIVVAVEKIEDLTVEFWQHYFSKFDEYIVLKPRFDHEVSYIGSGCPPIETKDGWLIIYHGVHDTVDGYVYSACAALLDLETPQKEIARLPLPLFFPEEIWELKGEVNNVCFPTGAVVDGDRLYIYYGAADQRIAVASVNMLELLQDLERNKVNPS